MSKKKTRPDGLIELKITIGKKLDGKPIRKSFYGHTKKEAADKAEEYKKQRQFGEIDDKISLADWADKWLTSYKEGKIKEITYENTYKYSIEKHIKKYFKDARLAAIKPIDIQNFVSSLSKYSGTVLRRIKLTLSALLNAAIDNDLIIKNPCRNIEFKSIKVSKQKRAYTKKECADIISFAKGHMDGAPIILMLKTGLRRSEVFALKWSDINFKNNTIHVRRSVAEVKGVLYLSTPKTKASTDEIPFDKELKVILQCLPKTTKIIKGKGKHRTETIIPNEFVFPNSKGKLQNPHNWSNRNYKQFCEDYKTQYQKEHEGKEPRILTIHELRHTFGSLVYEATKDIHITSKLMRHANINITSKTYVHETMENKQKAMAKVLRFTK